MIFCSQIFFLKILQMQNISNFFKKNEHQQRFKNKK